MESKLSLSMRMVLKWILLKLPKKPRRIHWFLIILNIYLEWYRSDLAAAVVALGTLVCQFWGPYTYRFMLLMRDPLPRIVVTACGGVVALGVLVCFFRLMFARREPSCVHPAGERNIEVTLAALSSCARTAAERDDRVMVEHVEARVQGSDESRVRFKVDAIALDDRDVASLAAAMQQRIEEGTAGKTTLT